MIEFDVDMGYLLERDELDKVVLNDENGEHEPMEFVPKDAATVGNSTDLSKRLREVHGLHAFAELFGFDWTGESDWDWHDVACAMADAVDAETMGRSCASCPEMDNPDSYIVHLQSDLKWHDEHVPRPTNPNTTCVVLQGERPPEEVMLVRKDGEVAHYLPEGTCVNEWAEFGKFRCSECGLQIDSISTNTIAPMPIRHCPNCGRRLKVSDR